MLITLISKYPYFPEVFERIKKHPYYPSCQFGRFLVRWPWSSVNLRADAGIVGEEFSPGITLATLADYWALCGV